MRRLAISALAAMAVLTSTSAAQERRLSEAERLDALGRVWVFADYFNPYLGSAGVDWDQALIDAIPAVRRARTQAELRAALNTMLAASGDPLAGVYDDDAGETPAPGEVVRVEGGAAIVDCTAAGQALATNGDAGALIASIARDDAPRGTVIDCRDFRGSDGELVALFDALVQARVTAPVPGGASQVRFHDGFPTQAGSSSGGYRAGMSAVNYDPLTPQQGAKLERALVFVIDEDMNFFAAQLGALQAAERVRVVSERAFEGDAAYLEVAGMTVRMTRGLYVYPDGGIGFRPDVIAEGDAGHRAALAQLDVVTTRERPAARLMRPRPAPRTYDGEDAPSPELRLLALYRLWGMVEYLYPYKALMDAPWDATLAEFAPVFLAANTREAYETAVLRLTARMDDSHGAVIGLRATLYGSAPARPGLLVRFVEGRPVVVEVLDAALNGVVAPGDEIVRVDGRPVAEIIERLTPLIAHSTPQGIRPPLARRMLAGPEGSTASLQLRGADGRLRTVRAPRLMQQPQRPPAPSWRMLEGNVGYINLERLTGAEADQALDELMGARALIFDLRGYPQGTAWTLAPRLARRDGEIIGARFRRPQYFGPPDGSGFAYWMSFEQPLPQRDNPRYAGPVFVMIDERAISQSEHAAMFFEAAADVTFVGEPTNGANGDVTQILLPGGIGVWMTGHDVRHPDGRQLQRVGVQPDVPVAPTIAGVRAGRDEVLERTLELARR